ncbi:phage tail protein [Agrobacterium rhizogenes]|uniref:phage tail protein n=1 Tax=Rhizobium rhizogenes TaxID=359 RepID=UPI0015716206|nr:phage tail protein [Rhizobium rhizogenes]NTG48962.1 phage tail protein [Rhizobium rhizogenes]
MAVFTAAALTGVLGSSFLASVSAFALNAAVGIGVSMLAQQLTKPADTQAINGVQGKLQAGGDVGRSIVLGKRCTAGSLVYANTWGKAGKTPNAYFTQVIALSDIPIGSISAVWVNGAPVTVDTSDTSYGDWGFPVVEYNTGNNNHMWIKFYDGTQTVADPFLVNTVSSSNRPYATTRVGRGVAYAIVTSQADDELFTGFPTFRFEVQGAKLYDVSRDSTAGGAGPHRWNDPSTWGGDGDDLPVVQIYNTLRGITYSGTWVYGLQSLTGARLPATDWIGQINKCRAGIEGPSGIEATYLTGTEVQVGTEIGKTIDGLLTGCHGRLIEAGGIYKVRVGEPGAAVFAFSDDNILSTDDQSFKPFLGLADSINGVSATYPEPNEAWNTKTAPPLYHAAYEARDGNRRLMTDLQLDMVYRSSQVQRIMKSALAEARRERRHTISLPPSAEVLEPGDIVAWTSNRNGYVAKLFRVDGVTDSADLDVTIDITEVDPSDYDWDQDHDYKPPIFAPLGPVMPPTQPMTGWQAQPAILYDASGRARRPSIEVFYDGDQIDVRAVRVQVRLAASGVVVFDGEIPYGDPASNANPSSVILNGIFLPNEDYLVRGEFVPYSGRPAEWSAWLAVTTPNVLLGDADVYLPGVVDELREFVGEATEWIRDGTRQALLDAQRNARLTTDQDMGTFVDRQSMRTDISSSTVSAIAALTAQYQSDIVTATGPTSALAQRLDQLNVSLVDTQSDVTANAGAIENLYTGLTNTNNTVSAISQSVTSLTSSLNDTNTNVSANATAITQLITKTDNTNDALSAASQQITTITSRIDDPTTGLIANANATTSLTTRVTASEGNISSISQQLTQVDATIIDLKTGVQANADASTLLSARVDTVNGTLSAQADSITSLNAQVGAVSASANFRMQVYAAPDGYSSRIGMEARGGSAGIYRSASLFIDVPASEAAPTRVAIVSDQFSITNDGYSQQPFIFQSGILTLNAANIGTVTAGLINGGPGAKMVIDITNGSITVSD